MAYAKGHLWENCSYSNIAIEPRNGWHVTKIFGDFEEGWETIDLVAFKNCSAVRGNATKIHDAG